MRALRECRLYGIIDLGYIPRLRDCNRIAEQMVSGGVDLIQLRGKGKSIEELMNLASEIHEITVRSNTPLIVNDHAEIAARVPVEGVHVGQDDDSIPVARQKAGRDLIVGKSTHSLDQAHAAQGEGADYIGFGPIFATPTKPDYKAIGLGNIRRIHLRCEHPNLLYRRNQHRQSSRGDRCRGEARCHGFGLAQGAQHC